MMKISYRVEYSGSIEIDPDEWAELKQDYNGDIIGFATTTVSESIREFNESAITITSIKE